MKKVFRYMHLWLLLTEKSFMVSLANRFSAILFLLGKILRFIFFVIFLLTLFSRVDVFAGYTSAQALFFFLTFNVLDTVTQLFFREVYRFRPLIVRGDFDLVLVKPFNPLFRSLLGGADPLDLIMMVPYVTLLIIIGLRSVDSLSLFSIIIYLILLLNGFIIAMGFHILVLALAVVTTEIDHAIMVYRDLTSMGRVPIDIYEGPIRAILTFVIPVGIMITVPVKVFLGLTAPIYIIFYIIFGLIFYLLCVYIWKKALKNYSSASS